MPREQITYNRVLESHTPAAVDGVPSATINVEEPRRNVHVSWHRFDCALQPDVTGACDGSVQIAVEVTVAELREILAMAEAEAQAEAEGPLAELGEYSVEAHSIRIVSTDLDRREVNTAIRTLRRARDAAHGVDE